MPTFIFVHSYNTSPSYLTWSVNPFQIERLAVASEEACSSIIRAFSDLMWAYNNVNPDRAAYFARKGLSLARSHDYLYRIIESNRILGQYHFGHGQYDSALFYYQAAEAILPSMEGKYPQGNIDDAASALYGTIGNLYVEMDSIPKAMEYRRLSSGTASACVPSSASHRPPPSWRKLSGEA